MHCMASSKQRKHRDWLIWMLCSQPLFIIVVKNWSNGILIIGGLISLAMLALQRNMGTRRISLPESTRAPLFFTIAFASLATTTLLAGVSRGHIDWSLLDSPARFLLAIPVFYFIRRSSTEVVHKLVLCVCLGLIFTLGHQMFFPHDRDWSAERMSNHFVDPLAFGYISLSLAFISLCSIHLPHKNSTAMVFLKALAGFIGIYMSVRTASRTGWIALPFVGLCLLYFYNHKIRIKALLGVVALCIAVLISGYQTSQIVKTRVDQTWQDIATYSFRGIAPDTSIGLRVTFVRMAMDMLREHPISGYGNTQKVHPAIPPTVSEYASPFAQGFALSSGFHNEIITNGIQSGIPAMIAVLLIFGVPLWIYIHAFSASDEQVKTAGLLGFVFGLTILISSMSTEVFGLKYTTSYYALMTAFLCGICLRTNKQNNLAP